MRRLSLHATLLLAISGSPTLAATPSFDCANASGAVEKLICSDDKLAELDRTLAGLYRAGEKKWDAHGVAEQKSVAEKWIARRNDCAKGPEPRACVESLYRRRIVALRIMNGELTAPTPVGFACKEHFETPFFASFYNQTDPPSAVLTFGDEQVTAFVVPSGSGARYTADGIEFWEHQGEATVDWRGSKMTCAVMK